MSFHPATLLFAWGVLVALLQSLTTIALVLLALLILPLVMLLARRRTLLLVRRARWLLLSIAVLFALATPGQRLPGTVGDIGLTQDGLMLAVEHVLRLLLLLASLAALHERLGTRGMMIGLYWLLAPLAQWRTLRERIVVRLMLVLDHLENAPKATWQQWLAGDQGGPDSLSLSVVAVRVRDWGVFVLLIALLLMIGVHG